MIRSISRNVAWKLVVMLLVLLAVHPAEGVRASAASDVSLIDIFPREGAQIPANSGVIISFRQLMNGTSVLDSIRVKPEIGIEFSLSLDGECGDPTTLIFRPSTGMWQPGNYTLRFNRMVSPASGLPFMPVPSEVNFTVIASTDVTMAAFAIDSRGTVARLISGSSGLLESGPVEITLEFSVEVDLTDLLRQLSGQGVGAKATECQAASVSLSLSLNDGSRIAFQLNSTGVVNRWNRTLTLQEPFFVSISSSTGILQVIVRDSAGNDLVGSLVTLAPRSGGPSQNATITQVPYTFGHLRPDTYTVCASYSGYTGACASVAVRAGEETSLTLILGPPGDPPPGSLAYVAYVAILVVVIALAGVALRHKKRPPPLRPPA